MSTLLNFTATATISGSGGFRMGGITLSAGTANATAIISEVTGTATAQKMQLTAAANTTIPHSMTDFENGAVFNGTVLLSTLTGNGASVNIEEM